jgi:hypothetical protein
MSNDVTAGYIVSDIERLRRPAQKISDFLLRAFRGEGRQVIPFPRAAAANSISETNVVRWASHSWKLAAWR